MKEAPGANLQTLFAERLKFEHDVIGHRMTWLMTLNGFLVGGGAVLVANQEKFEQGYGLTASLFAISMLGALSNCSSLFSNYWATRAIREAGAALGKSWLALDPAERERQLGQMRLYGRDPESFRGPSQPVPSQILHPWLFLPGIFTLFYICIAFVAGVISNDDLDLPSWWLAVTFGALSLFVLLPIWDVRFHNRRRVIEFSVGTSGGWPKTRRARRQAYAEQKGKVTAWLASSQDIDHARLVATRFGLIPRSTFDAYKAAELATQLPASRTRCRMRPWVSRRSDGAS